MSELDIRVVNKIYSQPGGGIEQAHHAIADLQVHVPANQFACLLGPSGCGKTTLLNMIAGLDKHYDGNIAVGKGGRNLRIGYVFQNPRLLPWRTVRQNIELAGGPVAEPDLIDSLLDSMQLSEMQNQFPQRLSLGMQRRVAIIRAFALNPDVLLMDEPFVSLDAPNARQVRNLLYALWQQRPHTVLFVTHDLREAIALADRLLFLSPRPMRLLGDIPVTVERSQRNNESEIEAFRVKLLQNHAEINGLL